jgi:hypothetical protein
MPLPQTVPHAPQLFESKNREVQALLQQVMGKAERPPEELQQAPPQQGWSQHPLLQQFWLAVQQVP